MVKKAAKFQSPAWRQSSPVNRQLVAALANGAPRILDLSDAEWSTFGEHARNHGLSPYLYQLWADGGVLNRIPAQLAERFARARHMNRRRNERILEQTAGICTSLSRRGLQVMILKGIPVSHEYYGDPGLRLLYDLDLLVRPEQLARTLQVMSELGYVPFFPDSDAGRQVLLWQPKRHLWDAEGVFDPERPLLIEIHTQAWESGWHGFRLRSSLDFWRDPRRLELSGFTFDCPREETVLVQLAVHYACNVLESSARLMHLLDVGLLLRARSHALDWAEVIHDIGVCRAAGFACVTLELARAVCGVEIPAGVRDELRRAAPSRIVKWLAEEGAADVASMNLHQRHPSIIYSLHWAMASGWRETAAVLLYAARSPWRQARGPKRIRTVLRRVFSRTHHLLSLLRRRRS